MQEELRIHTTEKWQHFSSMNRGNHYVACQLMAVQQIKMVGSGIDLDAHTHLQFSQVKIQQRELGSAD